MTNLYLLAALVLTLTGCDALTKPTSLKGTYRQIDKRRQFQTHAATIEFTTTKATLSEAFNQSFGYKIEDGYVYISDLRYQLISLDTLRNEDAPLGFKGTYVKVK